MSPIKLISLNIERSKHLDLIIPFLQREGPDVVCLQELMEYDIPRFEAALGGARCVYEPSARRPYEDPPGVMGLGIVSRLPVSIRRADYYVGKPGVLLDNIQSDEATYNNMNRVVLSADIEKEGSAFRIATTHFRWTPDGKPDQGQYLEMKQLLDVLARLGEFVLTGDFNAPRGLPGQGGAIFAMLSSRFKDNVPPAYTTSIDGSLHRRGPLEHMVDGLFTTPGYRASDVRLQFGVSDHAAIVARISKV